MNSLQIYRDQIVPAWVAEDKLSSKHAVPHIVKISVNMGLKDAVNDRQVPDAALRDLAAITGQKAVLTLARKSIAGFKIREGMVLGAKVVLRRQRMYDFFDCLVRVALPRVRDFRGLPSRAFDGKGNYSIGLTEQIIFPEINIEKIYRIRGLDVTIVTSAADDIQARRLLDAMGVPIKK